MKYYIYIQREIYILLINSISRNLGLMWFNKIFRRGTGFKDKFQFFYFIVLYIPITSSNGVLSKVGINSNRR